MGPSTRRIAEARLADTHRIVCVGDVSGARDIEAMTDERVDPSYPFTRTQSILEGAYSVGNLECVLSDRTPDELNPKPNGIHLLAPTAFARTVRRAGFNAVSMANNHVCDYGPDGIRDTVSALEGAGVAHFGAGADARRPHIANVGGTLVAFVGFVAPHLVGRPGANVLDDTAPVQVARAKDAADLVFVSVHWGEEYKPANGTQKEQARMLARAGADLVFGHHPHVTQAIEYFGRTPVFYSLGNFAFDSHKGGGRTRVGFAAEVMVSRDGVREAAILPYKIGRGYVPEFMEKPYRVVPKSR